MNDFKPNYYSVIRDKKKKFTNCKHMNHQKKR